MPDGSTIYRGVSEATDVLAESSGADIRMSIVLTAPSAPEAYEIPIPNQSVATVQPDGSVQVAVPGPAGGDSASFLIMTIDRPWAYDANGSPVPTHFEVRAGVLFQVIDHVGANAAYPVVADPTIRTGWWSIFPVYFVTYSKAETRSAAALLNDGGSSLPSVFCGAIPGWAGTAACIAVFIAVKSDIQYNANYAVAHSRCLTLRLPAIGGAVDMVAYDASTKAC
jgi:hypothetical protein